MLGKNGLLVVAGALLLGTACADEVAFLETSGGEAGMAGEAQGVALAPAGQLPRGAPAWERAREAPARQLAREAPAGQLVQRVALALQVQQATPEAAAAGHRWALWSLSIAKRLQPGPATSVIPS